MRRIDFRRICLLAGAILLIAAVALPFFWQAGVQASREEMEKSLDMIRTRIPEPRSAFPEERRNNAMPILSLDGVDFVGILEIPRYGAVLPVCADWGEISRHPCRLDGSIYDGSMQIGGTSQAGQFDFYRELSHGDTLYFTDMEGNRYGYTVTDIRYESHADQTALQRKEAALTLFVKNVFGFEYIVIFCNPMG